VTGGDFNAMENENVVGAAGNTAIIQQLQVALKLQFYHQ
jgi:hypothetical protein